MKFRLVPVVAIALFVLSGISMIYAAWAFSKSREYIAEMVAAGQLVLEGSEYDVASFYMGSSGQYAFFAVILAALGLALLTLARLHQERHQTLSGDVEAAPRSGSRDREDDPEDEELDDLLAAMETTARPRSPRNRTDAP